MRGEGVRRNPADADDRRQLGEEIDEALKLAKVTRKVAAGRMGYGDTTTLDRWCAGRSAETPNFAKLRAIGLRFRRALLFVQARNIGIGVRAKYTVEIDEFDLDEATAS